MYGPRIRRMPPMLQGVPLPPPTSPPPTHPHPPSLPPTHPPHPYTPIPGEPPRGAAAPQCWPAPAPAPRCQAPRACRGCRAGRTTGRRWVAVGQKKPLVFHAGDAANSPFFIYPHTDSHPPCLPHQPACPPTATPPHTLHRIPSPTTCTHLYLVANCSSAAARRGSEAEAGAMQKLNISLIDSGSAPSSPAAPLTLSCTGGAAPGRCGCRQQNTHPERGASPPTILVLASIDSSTQVRKDPTPTPQHTDLLAKEVGGVEQRLALKGGQQGAAARRWHSSGGVNSQGREERITTHRIPGHRAMTRDGCTTLAGRTQGTPEGFVGLKPRKRLKVLKLREEPSGGGRHLIQGYLPRWIQEGGRWQEQARA